MLKTTKYITKLLLRTIMVLMGVYLGLFLVVMVVLHSPQVQQRLVPFIRAELTEALGAEVELESIRLELFDILKLEGLALHDTTGLKFVQLEELRIGMMSFSFLNLLASTDEPKRFGARSLTLVNPSLTVIRDQKRRWNFDFMKGPKDTTQQGTRFSVDLDFPSIEVQHLYLRMQDSAKGPARMAPARDYFNYRNFEFQDINLATSLRLDDHSFLELELLNVSGLETFSEINLHYLAGNVSGYVDSTIYDSPLGLSPAVVMDNMRLKLNETELDFDLVFADEILPNMLLKKNRNLDIELQPSRLDINAVNYFTRSKLPVRGVFDIEGRVVGNYQNLASDAFKVRASDNTELEFSFAIADYIQPETFKFEAVFAPSTVQFSDFSNLLPGVTLPKEFQRLQSTRFTGSFKGMLEDFKTELIAETPLGNIRADLRLFFANTEWGMGYEGNLTTEDFKLQQLLNLPSSNGLNIRTHLEGRGTKLSTMETKLSFWLQRSDCLGFEIDSASGDITVNRNLITGNLDVRDAQGSFNGRVEYSQREQVPHYTAMGELKALNLNHYGVTDDTLLVSTLLNLDLSGDSLDVMQGLVRTFYVELENPVKRKSILLSHSTLRIYTNGPRQKQILVDSDWAKLSLNGNFRYNSLGTSLTNLAKELQYHFRNDPLQLTNYYAKKPAVKDSVQLEIDLQTRYLDDALAFWGLGIGQVAIGSTLSASLQLGQAQTIQFELASDSVLVGARSIQFIVADGRLAKAATDQFFSGGITAAVASLAVTNQIVFTDLTLKPIVRGPIFDFAVDATQKGSTNEFHFSGLMRFFPDNVKFSLRPESSYLTLNDSVWRVSEANVVEFGYAPWLSIRDLAFQNGAQSIRAVAAVQVPTGQKRDLEFSIRNLDVQTVQDFLPQDLDMRGVINAEVTIQQLFGVPVLEFNGDLTQFQYGGVDIGTVSIATEYREQQQRLNVNAALIQDMRKLLQVKGDFYPYDTISPLRFNITSDDLPLDLAQPFYDSVLYDVKGRLNIAQMSLTGTLSNPQLNGTLQLDGVQFGVEYFKKVFCLGSTFNTLTLKQNQILVNNLTLYDDQPPPRPDPRHSLVVQGSISHTAFQDMRFNLSYSVAEGSDFVLMNTNKRDNDLFYGRTIIAKGSGSITGPLSDLHIRSAATTAPGTVLSIPLTSFTQAERLDFVEFLTPERSATEALAAIDSSLRFTFELEAEATQDALMRIIFDELAGDIISARGIGTVSMVYTPEGELSLAGVYEILEGDYMFTFRNIINKEFIIERGSTIAWDGDAYNAQTNITAVYRRDVPLSSLDTTLSGTRPVEVVMHMTGDLYKPNISFKINIPNVTQDQGYKIISKLAYIESDEAEFNRQVFSLLLFNQFAPIGGFIAEGGGGVGSSVSEFLSNQLNNLIGQSLNTQNLAVRLQTAQDVVSLGLRLSLMNDRLTIERNGSLNNANSNDLSLGNISIQFKILPPPNRNSARGGVLVAEVFNRENLVSQSIVSGSRGVGLFYRQDFERLADLFRRKEVAPGTP